MTNKMKYVLTVYQEKSFLKASQKLYISQAAVSKIVKQVENEIGVKIFNRGTIPITLTEEGKIYIQYAKQIYHLENELQSYFKNLYNLKVGNLCIGGSSFFCSYIFPELLGIYARKYPGIKLELKEGNIKDLKDGIEDESIDYIFETGISNMDDSFVMRCISQDSIILAVPAAYDLNYSLRKFKLNPDLICGAGYLDDAAPVPIKKIAHLPFISLTEGNDLHNRTLAICRESSFVPDIYMEVEQIVTALNLCAAGLGVTFTRSYMTKIYDYSKTVCFYKIESLLALRNIYMISKKSRIPTPAMNAFNNLIAEKYQVPDV